MEFLVASEVNLSLFGVDGLKSFLEFEVENRAFRTSFYLGHFLEVGEHGFREFSIFVAHKLKTKLRSSSHEAVSAHLKLLESGGTIVVEINELFEDHFGDSGGLIKWKTHGSKVVQGKGNSTKELVNKMLTKTNIDLNFLLLILRNPFRKFAEYLRLNEIHGLLSASSIILWGEDSIASDVTEFEIFFEEPGVVFHEVSVHLVVLLRNKLRD